MSSLRPLAVPDEWSAAFAREFAGRWRDLVTILNGGLRLADQFAFVRLGAKWNSIYGSIRLGPVRAPKWVIVLSARSTGAESAVATGTPPVTWTYDGASVVISRIDGLAPGVEYDVDVLVMEG